jgi:hypothetical protein
MNRSSAIALVQPGGWDTVPGRTPGAAAEPKGKLRLQKPGSTAWCATAQTPHTLRIERPCARKRGPPCLPAAPTIFAIFSASLVWNGAAHSIGFIINDS